MPSVEIGRNQSNEPILLEYDDDWSLQDFTNRDLSLEDLSGKAIYKSCFSQSVLDSHPFPVDMAGTTFYGCNLDNCVLPTGNQISQVLPGSHRRILSREDGDYLVDDQNNPTVKL